jgi:hypothetical protein
MGGLRRRTWGCNASALTSPVLVAVPFPICASKWGASLTGRSLRKTARPRASAPSLTQRPFPTELRLKGGNWWLAPLRRGGLAHETHSPGRIAIVFKAEYSRIPATDNLREHKAQIDIRIRDCLG